MKERRAVRVALTLMIVVIMLSTPAISMARTVSGNAEDGILPSPTPNLSRNLTRNEGVVVSAQMLSGLIGTPVNNTDVKSPDNDILVYAWNETTGEWRQIPFQVDERNETTGLYIDASNGVLDGIDEIVFMSGDAGDKAPGNAWPVGCDAPRYEVEVTDPLSGEKAWAYIFKSSTVEASFSEDYVHFDMDTNTISAQTYIIGFHHDSSSAVGMVVDRFNVTSSGGGDGSNLLDLLQMELHAGAAGQNRDYDEDDLGDDFNIKKDGYVRGLGAVSWYKHYEYSSILGDLYVDAYFNFTWFFYPEYVNASGYLDLSITGSLAGQVTVDLWMGLDNSPDACPMDYRDSLGNTAVVDGNPDTLSDTSDMERWWEMSGEHGGYVCLWNLEDIQAGTKKIKYDDNSSYDESSGTSHAWADHRGHYGLAGSNLSDLTHVQVGWANISLYPLPADVDGKAENCLTNETNPLQISTKEQHSPTVWVNKGADKSSIDSQDTIQYVIYFNNTGDRTAPHVWINDTLPPEMTYVSDNASQSGGTRTGDYNWTFTDVAPGNHWFVINCTVDAEPGKYITNNVHCDFTNQTGAKMPSSEDSYTVHVKSPVIEVDKVADKGSASPGEEVVYTIYFNNTGESAAEKVWINDTLPASVEYVSDTSSSEGGTKTGDYTWEFDNVDVGSHSFTITVKAKDVDDGTAADNHVHLDYTAPGGYHMDSSDAWANITIYRPELSVSAAANLSSGVAGDALAYNVYFNNTGRSSASKLWVNVTLPDAVTYVDDTSSSEGGSKTGDYNWTFTDVAPGSHSFQINVTVKGGYEDLTSLSAGVSAEYISSGGVKYSSADDAESVLYAPSITVEMSSDVSTVDPDSTPGAPIQYTISFYNNGHSAASTVWINETLPSNVEYVSDSNSTEGGTKTGDYSWVFHDVAPGAHSFVINVTVNQSLVEGDYINNTVHLDYKDAAGVSMASSTDTVVIKATKGVLIQDLTSGNPTTGDEFQISANVTAEKGVSGVYLYYWFETLSGNTQPTNVSMSGNGDIYSYAITAPSDATVLHYNISGVDSGGNWSQTGEKTLSVGDNDAPSVEETTQSMARPGEDYNITADADDNIGVSAAYLDYIITYADGNTSSGNVTMNLNGGTYWYLLSLDSNSTWVNYTISARDSAGNWNSTEKHVYVDGTPPKVSDSTSGTPTTGDDFTLSADVTDDGTVTEVYAEYWFGSGSHSNESMSHASGNTWELTISIPSDSTDALHYIFHASDASGNWNSSDEATRNVLDNDAPVVSDSTSGTPTTGDSFTIRCTVTDNIQVSSVYAEYWFGSGSHSNESMSGTGTYELSITAPSDSTDALHYIIRASDGSNWAHTDEKSLSVEDNDPPVADAGPEQSVIVGETVNFDGSASTDNIGISSYTWTFDDGGTVTLHGATPTYVFNSPGNFTITLTVEDEAGNSAQDTTTIHVSLGPDTTPPEIEDATEGTPTTGDHFTIEASISDDREVGSAYVEYWFDTVSGSTDRANVSMNSDSGAWSYVVTVPADATLLHYIFHASDAAGNWNSRGEMSRDVLDNDAPVAELTISGRIDGSIVAGKEVSLDGSASSDNIGIENYTWYINGSSGSEVLYGRSVSYTFRSSGEYTITLVVSDSANNRNSVQTQESVVSEQHGTELPESGAGPMNWWWLILAVLIVLGIVLLVAKRKKAEEEPAEEEASGEEGAEDSEEGPEAEEGESVEAEEETEI